MTEPRPTSFEHTNLKDVQVSTGFGDRPAIADGMYNYEVIKAELKDYVSGPNSKNPGTEGQMINFTYAIVGDANFAGRRVFQPALFPGKKTDEQLRLISDVTGIQQVEPGIAGVVAWLNSLVENKARFYGPLENFVDSYDPANPREKTRVNLWRVAPFQG